MLNKLWVQVLIGMVLGVVVGLILSPSAFALVPEDIMMVCNAHNVNPDTENHVVVLGYGRFGQAIVEELKVFGQKYVIIEHNIKINS